MSDLAVKTVTTCKCGCGEVPTAGRDYCWGHKGGAAKEDRATPAKSATNGKVDFRSILKHLEGERDKLDAAIYAIRPLVLP